MSLRVKIEAPEPPPESRITARQSDPNKELRLVAEVRSMEHPEDFVVGGQVDHERREVVLVRGDFTKVVVPFAWFTAPTTGPAPDFNNFEIVDTGETLRFGDYETAVAAVLGQHDLRLLGGR